METNPGIVDTFSQEAENGERSQAQAFQQELYFQERRPGLSVDLSFY